MQADSVPAHNFRKACVEGVVLDQRSWTGRVWFSSAGVRDELIFVAIWAAVAFPDAETFEAVS